MWFGMMSAIETAAHSIRLAWQTPIGENWLRWHCSWGVPITLVIHGRYVELVVEIDECT